MLAPVPVIPPGLTVQFPAGKPFNTTLPIANVQEGCVMVPTNGADGVAGCALITIFAEATEVQPNALVTVKVYVPEARPEIVLLAPVPTSPPGLIVQFPVGKPFNTTLPVDNIQLGCVMVPTIGADGVEGCALIAIFADATEVHPTAFATV